MNATILSANLWTMGLNLLFAIIAMLIGLATLKFVDHLVFPEINLIAEIKRGNIAAAIFAGMGLLFLALVLSSAIR